MLELPRLIHSAQFRRDKTMTSSTIDDILNTIESLLGVKTGLAWRAPQDYVRELYVKWKADGLTVGGKPRHSDRFLDEELRKRATPVRSLKPKLGKTKANLQRNDVLILSEYFLNNWPKSDSDETEHVNYISLISPEDIKVMSSFLVNQIDNVSLHNDSGHRDMPEKADDTPFPGDNVADLIVQYFERCDALITVAPEHVLVAAAPKTELIGFRTLIDRLREVERRTAKIRPLIWVLDRGDLNMEDASSRKKFLNIESLISRFKSLRIFFDSEQTERLTWLQARAIIVILDIKQISPAVSPQTFLRPIFSAHHITLTTTANDWLKDSNFRALYGRDLDDVDQRSFSVFFKSDGWDQTTSTMKYLGYAVFKNPNRPDDYRGRGLELTTLPGRYEIGFETVCASAFQKLELGENAPEALEIDGETAIQQLSYLGFSVLRLDEFLRQY